MYEFPYPPIGFTVWHKKREEFGKVICDSKDPDAVILKFEDGEAEVSRSMLQKSIFREDNRISEPYSEMT